MCNLLTVYNTLPYCFFGYNFKKTWDKIYFHIRNLNFLVYNIIIISNIML